MKFVPVPAVRMIYLLLIPVFMILFSVFVPVNVNIIILTDLFILFFAAADLINGYENRFIDINQEPDKVFYMNQPEEISIEVVSGNKNDFYAEINFDLPQFWSADERGVEYLIRRNQSTVLKSRLTAKRRGRYLFNTVHLRFKSRFKLFRFYGKASLNTQVSVYPDYRQLKEYFFLTRSNRLFEMGIHKNRYQGHGTEMESLREYTKDDDARFIEWKASSRLNRPVTKVFEMESTNDIVFVLDCGRLMTSEENNLSSLDHAVQALLVLSNAAVLMGDRIRIVAFSDRIIGDYSPPRYGNPMKKIINFITPIQAEFTESNYSLVFTHLQNSIKKRSLVILVSDLIDDINYNLFKKNLMLLGRRNAVLFLLLRDSLLQEAADSSADTISDIYNVTAARSMFINRSKALFKLKQTGITVLDLLPGQVTARLVDKYMQMKADNRI